ncbi:hypothetical protein B0H10DRAFT_2440147 [Mycena sp. CBHHK59/15]|nr:hypothetical protein B0H10DRAFT_2440147 [Mycena sp. CBHHK59/15]
MAFTTGVRAGGCAHVAQAISLSVSSPTQHQTAANASADHEHIRSRSPAAIAKNVSPPPPVPVRMASSTLRRKSKRKIVCQLVSSARKMHPCRLNASHHSGSHDQAYKPVPSSPHVLVQPHHRLHIAGLSGASPTQRSGEVHARDSPFDTRALVPLRRTHYHSPSATDVSPRLRQSLALARPRLHPRPSLLKRIHPASLYPLLPSTHDPCHRKKTTLFEPSDDALITAAKPPRPPHRSPRWPSPQARRVLVAVWCVRAVATRAAHPAADLERPQFGVERELVGALVAWDPTQLFPTHHTTVAPARSYTPTPSSLASTHLALARIHPMPHAPPLAVPAEQHLNCLGLPSYSRTVVPVSVPTPNPITITHGVLAALRSTLLASARPLARIHVCPSASTSPPTLARIRARLQLSSFSRRVSWGAGLRDLLYVHAASYTPIVAPQLSFDTRALPRLPTECVWSHRVPRTRSKPHFSASTPPSPSYPRRRGWEREWDAILVSRIGSRVPGRDSARLRGDAGFLHDPSDRPITKDTDCGIQSDFDCILACLNLPEGFIDDIATLNTDIERQSDAGTAARDEEDDDGRWCFFIQARNSADLCTDQQSIF